MGELPLSGDRSFLLYYASVMLREAKARRGQNVQWMLTGAARARREAFAMRPAQAELFASPSLVAAPGRATTAGRAQPLHHVRHDPTDQLGTKATGGVRSSHSTAVSQPEQRDHD